METIIDEIKALGIEIDYKSNFSKVNLHRVRKLCITN